MKDTIFAEAIGQISQGVLIAGPDRRIIFCNRAFCEITGYEDSDFIGTTCHILQGPETDPDTIRAISDALRDHVEFAGEILNYRKSGEAFWNDLTITPIFAPDGALDCYIGVTRDITERKRAEDQLDQAKQDAELQKQRFELAAKATQEVIFDWNIETLEFWANDAFQRVFGHPPPNHLRFDGSDTFQVTQEERERIEKAIWATLRSDENTLSLEYDVERADGSQARALVRAYILRDASGKPQRLVGSAVDISERLKTMNALRESEERFRVIADTVSDVLWDHDLEKDVMWVSEDWPSKLGVSIPACEAHQTQWFQRVVPDDRERLKRSFHAALKSEARNWEAAFRVVGDDGHEIDVQMKGAIFRRPDGRVHRMLGNVQNISRQKRQVEGFSRSRALEAVGQLTGGIAHDFNNQLMIIQGNADYLEETALDEDQKESVDFISKASESAATLTERLLAFSRQSQIAVQSVDLRELLPRTLRLLQSGLPESITVELKVPESTWRVAADANALEQAVVNLAFNARDAMPQGGDIVLSCENQTISDDMEPFPSELEPDDYVVLSVTDNGEGMPPEVLARAFEPFFSTKEVGKGSGLGLSTVYGFAKQSRGHVTIYSEPGRGTAVNLYLRRVGGEQNDDAAPASAAMDETFQGKRILVVEDQPMVRAHVEKLLERMGYDVTSAANAPEALDAIRGSDTFDLMFTDVIMPGGMNGQELAEEAREIDPQLKVLFTSGYPAFAFDSLGLEERNDLRILRKPYKAAALREAIANMLAVGESE
ncbi:PAS domain S-box protein [Erythrobacter sp.]|uniref:PAS domain S-box protein n=1 Tax=Erythrobacter sp. TaxID=1042 RepID=UPI001425D78E|nr:PAS domain S-box protein [Erythrobacter sp.]QIQ87798.1 MAG: PAS domain S-box protein [Erythrobacter sp.]